jgi:hypothetical protein
MSKKMWVIKVGAKTAGLLFLLFGVGAAITANAGPMENRIFPSKNIKASVLSSFNAGFDSLNVRFVGNWPFGPPHAVACDSTRKAAFLGSGGGVYILDVSDPKNPVKISEAIHTRGIVTDLCYSNNRLYIADGKGGLEIWDISILTTPEKLGSCFTPEDAQGVSVTGSYCCVADGNAGLKIIDISNPKNPLTIGSNKTPGSAMRVAVSGSYCYVVNHSGVPPHTQYGLEIVDISNPQNPEEILSGRGGYDIAVSGSYCYTSQDSGLEITIVTAPDNLSEIGFYKTQGFTQNVQDVAVSDSFCYLVASDGLRIINIADPQNPIEIGSLLSLVNCYRVAVSEPYCYVTPTTEWGSLGIIDVSDPHNPILVGSCGADWKVDDMAVTDSFCYLTSPTSLQIIDISNPQKPTPVGLLKTTATTIGVAVSGSYCYIIIDTIGLRIIDVHNPNNPVEVGFYKTQGIAQDVAVYGSYCYLADANSALRIIDVSDPRHPVQVGVFPLSEAHKLAITEHYCYIAGVFTSLWIIHMLSPDCPEAVGFYQTPEKPIAIAVSEPYCYLADANDGLQIYANMALGVDENRSEKISPLQSEILNNPITGEVKLQLRLPSPGSFKIGVFNLLGQKVKSLHDRFFAAGVQTIVLPTNDLTAGVYFIAVQTGAQTQVLKVVKLK